MTSTRVQIVRKWSTEPAGWDRAGTFAVVVDGEVAFFQRSERAWTEGETEITHSHGDMFDTPAFAHEEIEAAWWEFCERMERAP